MACARHCLRTSTQTKPVGAAAHNVIGLCPKCLRGGRRAIVVVVWTGSRPRWAQQSLGRRARDPREHDDGPRERRQRKTKEKRRRKSERASERARGRPRTQEEKTAKTGGPRAREVSLLLCTSTGTSSNTGSMPYSRLLPVWRWPKPAGNSKTRWLVETKTAANSQAARFFSPAACLPPVRGGAGGGAGGGR